MALLYLVIFLCRQFQMMLMLMESNPQLASALGRGFSAFSQEIERLEKGKELEVLTPIYCLVQGHVILIHQDVSIIPSIDFYEVSNGKRETVTLPLNYYPNK